MLVPGSNLLAMALTVIGSTPVDYFAFQSAETGPTGLDLTTYADKVTISTGSVQAVDKSRYTELGLDWAKTYRVWYVPELDAQSISRDPDDNGDVFETLGRRHQAVGGTDWFGIDGWLSIIGVDIGPATGATTNA
jgi:hypothetical protein